MSKLTFVVLAITLLFTHTIALPLGGNTAFTQYWVTSESDFKSGGKTTIRTCDGQPLATVNTAFAQAMRTEGTGLANGGTMFNLGDCDCGNGFSCFEKVDRTTYPFGVTSEGQPLSAFVSVAANDKPIGTKLYVPAIDGLQLPNGKKHNGCVVVTDRGYGFGGNHIDWFIPTENAYNQLKDKLPENTNVQAKNCVLQKYTQ